VIDMDPWSGIYRYLSKWLLKREGLIVRSFRSADALSTTHVYAGTRLDGCRERNVNVDGLNLHEEDSYERDLPSSLVTKLHDRNEK
jgi:hypothetical protein